MIKLRRGMKHININRGDEKLRIKVDDHLFEKINKHHWYLDDSNGINIYTKKYIKVGLKEHLNLASFIKGKKKNHFITHANNDEYDFTENNLVFMPRKFANQKRHALNKNNTSGVRGVYLNAKTEKWYGRACFNYTIINCGTFDTIEECERAVIAKRKELGFLGETK